MKFLALLSAMPFESNQILIRLKNVRTVKIGNKTMYRGKLSGWDLLLFTTGIGKINAAHAATCILEHFSIKKIINLGVGGAYPGSGLKIGDIAVASREIYGDEGVITSQGFRGMTKIGIPSVQAGKKKYFNEFPLYHPPSLFCKKGRGREEGALRINSGIFVTLSASTGTQKRARELEKRFGALCENMEGAAIAHVCTLYKIPMIEIRGISNIVGTRDKRRWNVKLASENCQKKVLDVISSPA